MAADTVVLVAAATRQVGRRGTTYSVMHLPDPGTPGRAYCDWPGYLWPMTVAQATKAQAVSCNRCPLIKASRTRP